MHHTDDDSDTPTTKPRTRPLYDLDRYINSNGLECVRVVVRSKPGSACRREDTLFAVPIASEKLAEWKARAARVRLPAGTTVATRAEALRSIWRSIHLPQKSD